MSVPLNIAKNDLYRENYNEKKTQHNTHKRIKIGGELFSDLIIVCVENVLSCNLYHLISYTKRNSYNKSGK